MSQYPYYGVQRGRKPGVYDNWPDTEDQVAGFKNNRFKGFYTYEEAEAFVRGERDDRLELIVGGRVTRLSLDADLLARLESAGLLAPND